jgi:NAD(P)-dependent dehydrogenase (short-subunit alcohol dehydrogenase family)
MEKIELVPGKIVIVTGSAQGIGRGIAEVFAEHGAHVVVVDVNLQGAQEVVNTIVASGGPEAMALKVDITKPVEVQEMVENVVAKFGEVNVLVNNAAVMRNHYIVDFLVEDWQLVFKVNMEGTFLCSQAVAKQMIKQGKGGSIISISSCAANKADRKHAAYSATKSAVITFSRILALECGQYNIRANCILPGATDSEMLRGVFENVPGIREELLEKTTLGKFASTRDQANAAVFLASDMATHITGEYLIVSGGEFMNA